MERKKREGREWEVDSERRGDDGKGGNRIKVEGEKKALDPPYQNLGSATGQKRCVKALI